MRLRQRSYSLVFLVVTWGCVFAQISYISDFLMSSLTLSGCWTACVAGGLPRYNNLILLFSLLTTFVCWRNFDWNGVVIIYRSKAWYFVHLVEQMQLLRLAEGGRPSAWQRAVFAVCQLCCLLSHLRTSYFLTPLENRADGIAVTDCHVELAPVEAELWGRCKERSVCFRGKC